MARQGRLLARALQSSSRSSTPLRISPSVFRHCSFTQAPRLSIYPARYFSSGLSRRNQAHAVADEISTSESPQEFTTFEELGQHGIISPKVIDTIVNRMNIHTMTDVQRMTLNECLDGSDVIAQAKTGTGKTLAFLMPIIQRILRDPKLESRSRFPKAATGDIRALIISPTRELAEQIANDARKVTANTSVVVQTAVGGTQKRFHLQKMQREGCHILVGTPGRVNDILSDPDSGVRLDNIETFVLDEADRLLDIGFLPTIEEIQRYMPSRSERPRQTLMFSATVPKEVVSLVRQTLRPDFKFVRTVDPDDSPTHEVIKQHVVQLPGLQNRLPALLEIILNAIEANKRDPVNNSPLKALIFFSSTSEVALATQVFRSLREPDGGDYKRKIFAPHPLGTIPLLEIHSRLNQNQRTYSTSRFRESESAVMFSSDVSARGMHFPNVSHVIQVGVPRTAEEYIHRVGRTGRMGKGGEGWLLIDKTESFEFQKRFRNSGIKMSENHDIQTAKLDMTQGAQLPAETVQIMQMIESGVRATPYTLKQQCYLSMLGPMLLGGDARDKQDGADMLNDLARYGWGMETPPPVPSGLLEKMGLAGIRGFNVQPDPPRRRGTESSAQSPRSSRNHQAFDPRDPFGQGLGRGMAVGRNRQSRPDASGRNRRSADSSDPFDRRRSSRRNDDPFARGEERDWMR